MPLALQELQMSDTGPRNTTRRHDRCADDAANRAIPGGPVPAFACGLARIRSECAARPAQPPAASGSWFWAAVEFASWINPYLQHIREAERPAQAFKKHRGARDPGTRQGGRALENPTIKLSTPHRPEPSEPRAWWIDRPCESAFSLRSWDRAAPRRATTIRSRTRSDRAPASEGQGPANSPARPERSAQAP